MRTEYDIIVIGAGSAGLSVSLFTGRIGLRTLLIDKTPDHFGGDCLNYGCVPSKALIHVAKILHSARAASVFGLDNRGEVNIAKIAEYIKHTQRTIRSHENPEYLKSKGIDTRTGVATFTSENTIRVNEETFSARRIVIATGSRPATPEVKGIEKVNLHTNESIFDLTSVPARWLVLGGGPAGIEMAQCLQRLGCTVTVIQRNKNILPKDDRAITDVLKTQLEHEGITILCDAAVSEFNQNEATLQINGKEERIGFDAVFAATGRVIDTSTLNLAAAGVTVNDNRIVRDQSLRTSNPRVYLCGDIAQDLQFSHAAEHHARVLLNNMFSPLKKSINETTMSWVTFTDPQVATFGSSEAHLKTTGKKYTRIDYNFDDDDRATVDNYRYGRLVLFITPGSYLRKSRILGGSMIAPHAGELIQELILAKENGLPIDALFEKIYPYPVASRVNQLAIVKHKDKQLTPFVGVILRRLFRI